VYVGTSALLQGTFAVGMGYKPLAFSYRLQNVGYDTIPVKQTHQMIFNLVGCTANHLSLSFTLMFLGT